MALPLLLPLIGAAGAAAGGALGLGLGVGKNDRRASSFYDPDGTKKTGYDANASNYGGYANGLRDYQANLAVDKNAVENRGAFQADYAQAEGDRARGLGARSGAMSMADLIASRARGEVPSVAQMQADRQMGQAVASQNAQAASARGAAGRALAGQVAAGNIANSQSAISNSAQINASQEKERAEANAVGAYQGIRQGDQTAEGLAGQRSQFNTQMQQTNRDANDARGMNYDNLAARANESQLNAKMQNQGILAQSHGQADTTNQQTAQNNANNSKGWFEKMFSDANAKLPIPSFGLGAPAGVGGGVDMGGKGSISGEDVKRASSGTEGNPGMPGMVGGGGITGGNMGGLGMVGGEAMGGSGGLLGFFSDRNTKYDTSLSPDEEREFQAWLKKHAPRGDRGADYDYRGAWKAGVTPDKSMHWPDTFKKPNHETFSNESQYANESNAKGQGRWDGPNGDRFTPPSKLGLTRGPEGLGVGDPNAPKMQFTPGRGWALPRTEEDDRDEAGKAELDRAMASQVEQDRADIEIDRQLEEQKAEDARRARDPAVGLGRAPKGYAKQRAAEMPAEEAPSSKYSGMAPGTEDFERTAPKKDEKTPWWMTPVDGRSLTGLGFFSDERAKKAAFEDGARYATKQITGEEMQPWSPDDKNEGDDDEAPDPNKDYVAPSGPHPLPAPPPAKTPAAEANRSMVGSAYAYKPGLTPPSQAPGEVNFGPMAQNLEKSPVAATAVKEDPTTGLKMLDRDKLLKVVAAGVADLQQQQDSTRASMQRLRVSAGNGRRRR